MDTAKILKTARSVMDRECAAIRQARDCLDGGFAKAVGIILRCRGKIVITGMGKSGIIGKKISATLASTGTPSAFLHPGDAVHGDLGMIAKDDTVIAISNSGETDELLRILPSIRKIGARIISLTGARSSTLSSYSDAVIVTGEIVEADPFGLIPSSSTTCALVVGDALAVTLLVLRGFKKEDFAFFHPAGNLGKRLMLKVRDVMQTGKKIPMIPDSATLAAAIREINRKNLGFTLVVDKAGRLSGIVTDGDLRRFVAVGGSITGADLRSCTTPNPLTIREDRLAAQALALMEEREITCLAILDERRRPKGIVHLHDVLGKKEFRLDV